MRLIPPSLEGLDSLLNMSLPLGIAEGELEDLCRSAGIQVLELGINRRKVRLANREAVYAAVARHLAPKDRPKSHQQRLDQQDRQIQALQRQLAELQALRGTT